MHRSITPILFLAALLTFCLNAVDAQKPSKKGVAKWTPKFPKVKQIPQKWSFESAQAKGNISYTEYFYWMENANSTDQDLQKFVTDESILTESYMRQCNQDEVTKSVQDALNYDDISSIGLWGEPNSSVYLYSLKKAGDSSVIWYLASPAEFEAASKTNLNPPPGKPFLDESLLSADGSASIGLAVISNNAKIFAYQVSSPNSDLYTWHFRPTDLPLMTAKTFPEGGEGALPYSIPFCDDSTNIQWKSDDSGFVYYQQQDDNGGTNSGIGSKIRYHQWGTDYDQDITVFDAQNLGVPSNNVYTFMFLSIDDRWLIVSAYADTRAKVRTYATLLQGQTISNSMKWISLAPDYDFQMWYIQILDDWYYFQTDKNTENSKVSKVFLDFSKAKHIKLFNELQDRPKIVDVIPERKNAFITPGGTSVYAMAHDKAVAVYIEKGLNTLYLYDLKTGKLLQKLLPDEKFHFDVFFANIISDHAILQVESVDTPSKYYSLTFANDHIDTSLLVVQRIEGTKEGDFEVVESFATSKDGTKVPYFLASKKNTPKPGPVWVFAFAAYGIVYNLSFYTDFFVWLNNYYGSLCFCSARGGGEEGGAWHTAATGKNKQKTIDDIEACINDLVKSGVTTKGQIILGGNSAGALVLAAVANQVQAGLIGAVSLVRPALDVFQLELRTSIGENNLNEFGNVNDPNEVDSVLAWSPIQNIDPKKPFPPTILFPGQPGTTVIPVSNSYKYLAELQRTHPNSAVPLLMYQVPNTGNSPGLVLETTQEICFLESVLGLERRKR